MVGQRTINQGASLANLFDQEEIERIAEGYWDRVWSKFISFGTVSAGIIAILLIFQFIKLIIDAIIRCYTLHSIFGWSLHLLGAVFASITQLLVTLGKPETPKFEREMETIEREPLRNDPP